MKSLKTYFKPFLSGCLIAVIIALTMLKITMHFQILLILGSTLFYISGYLNSLSKGNLILVTLLITAPFCILFYLLILNELPNLWYFIPIFIISTVLGVGFKMQKRSRIALAFGLLLGLLIAINLIPYDLEKDLASLREDPLPEFMLTEMKGDQNLSTSLKNKVLVLDFFGTWCKPCILELEELDKVKDHFKGESDVLFYVVNADLGGDTPEKFKEFISNTDYEFQFVYDSGSDIYKKLSPDQAGLPVLLIIDKTQTIRYQHIGYNPAESNFSENLISIIESLR